MILANNATIILSREAVAKLLDDNKVFQLNQPKFVVLNGEADVKKLEKQLKYNNNPVSILKL